MRVTGGMLSEELAEMLTDYTLAFMGEDGPAGNWYYTMQHVSMGTPKQSWTIALMPWHRSTPSPIHYSSTTLIT